LQGFTTLAGGGTLGSIGEPLLALVLMESFFLLLLPSGCAGVD
jgi:hypothetical protein